MVLWVDKHRPTSIAKLECHSELSKRLQALATDGDIPHLLFHGPSGSGKKTRIMALLREIFGAGSEKLKLEHRTFRTPSNKPIEVTTVASNYHIEMNPADAGINDRFVVQEVIKEIAQSNPLQAGKSTRGFKVVLLVEVDRMTKQAQAALRRTMEKYTASCRLIMCCNNPSKVIEPVRSRCLSIRVGAPSSGEITTVLQCVARKENITLPAEMANRVAEHSGRNLRRALLMLEASRAACYPFVPNQHVELPDYEAYIAVLAKEITNEQSPQRLLAAREKMYELLTKCIPPDVILRTLARELMRSLDDELKHQVCALAAFYEHRIQCGNKEIFHLEAFVAKFMSLYKQFVLSMFG